MAKLKGHKINGRGTPQIDRHFPEPVGEIRLACGTHDAAAYRDINAMLTALAQQVPPRYDVLLAIREKRISPMHALGLYQMNKLHEVPQVEVLPPLAPRWELWKTKELEGCDQYRTQVASTLRRLLALNDGDEPTIGDVVELLKARRVECKAANTAVTFNRGKAHVQSFVWDVLGRRHPLYEAVTDIPTLPVDGQARRRAQHPEKLAELLVALPEPHLSIAWSLAVTAFRPKEYFSRQWAAVAPAGIHLVGTKTKAATRTVPLWVPGLPVMPLRSRSAFEGIWERRFGKGETSVLGIYDLRRSCSVWMEDAGIQRSRRKIYLGHGVGDITGMYERRELDDWRVKDARALWDYAGPWMPKMASEKLQLVVDALISSVA